jgi:hypothetical protein
MRNYTRDFTCVFVCTTWYALEYVDNNRKNLSKTTFTTKDSNSFFLK